MYELYLYLLGFILIIRTMEFMIEKEEDQAELNLEKSIDELELSVRSFNCLKRANINTVGQLTQKSESEMMKNRNLGKKL